MEHKLAIIIPYYKKTFFEATLVSLANQTDKRFNVYIGNDASPNNPDDLIEKYRQELNLVYKKFDQNLGGSFLTKQWDRCIALSENEPWLMILGDDDTLEENVVEKFYKNLPKTEEENIKVIRLASQLIDEQGNSISKIFKNPETEKAADSYMRAFRGNGRSTLTEHIFSRAAYEKHGFKHFPVAFGSDNVAWLEFPEMGDLLSINDAVAFIRISGEHLSSKKNHVLEVERRRGMYLFNRYIIKKYRAHFNPEDRFLILKKAYLFLTSSTTSKLKSLEFISFMLTKIPLHSVLRIIRENRNRS